ncbi:LysR family transcriptional regulator [beta proteobacterium AAP51]|nr:LysR family transcriptional regulator [beta proteobacterium AAP51]
MQHLNYKHLHYFWTVARCGGVAKAGEKLNVTPQSISTQMQQLAGSIGAPLWRRAGRTLELTDTGNLVLEYADRLFTVGEELKEALRERPGAAQSTLRVGVTGSVVKVVAYRTLEPVLRLEPRHRLLCREGRFNELLSLLAIQQLDAVISDRAMSGTLNVRGFNHLLSEGGITFLGSGALAKRARKRFPHSLHGAPMLLPGGDSAMRPQLMRWFDKLRIKPQVVGDFDDTAVMKAFGQGGAGLFPMPTMVAEETAKQFHVLPVGSTEEVTHQLWAVTCERRISSPAVLAISEAARRRQEAAAS